MFFYEPIANQTIFLVIFFFHGELGHAMFLVFTSASFDCSLPDFSVPHIKDLIKRQKILPI